MINISIPRPCLEDWDQMDPNDNGRHCISCARTVFDFSSMSDDELKMFFLNKKEERVCGRFKKEQLHQVIIDLPQNIFRVEMPWWKKFLTACLIAFSSMLFSCDTRMEVLPPGEPATLPQIPKQPEDNDKDRYFVGVSIVWDSVPPPGYPVVFKEAPRSANVDTLTVLDKVIASPLIEPVLTKDTVLINGPVKKIEADSSKILIEQKDPPKADSTNSNSIFY